MVTKYTGVKVIDVDRTVIDEVYKNKQVAIWDKRIGIYPNMFVYLKPNDGKENGAITIAKGDHLKLISEKGLSAFGIKPKNKEQIMALHSLLDDSIPLSIMTGRAGTGKAGSLDSVIYTPSGPVEMRDIKVGDYICTPDGHRALVDGVFPQGEKDVYKIIFTDGSSTETCDEHLWLTKTQKDRDLKKPGTVKELKEIRSTLKYLNYKRNHSIPITKPVDFDYQKINIDPYLLGCLIGDGSLTQNTNYFTNTDEDILNIVQDKLDLYGCKLKQVSEGAIEYRINGTYIRDEIKRLKLDVLSNQKFIPFEYKINTISNRIALLQGLMDTDGTVSKNQLSYTSVSEKLIKDVVFLVQSLGGTATVTKRIPKYTYKDEKLNGQLAYTAHINLSNDFWIFRARAKQNKYSGRTKYFPRRYIDKVEYIGKKECQCISVNHPDHLYLTDEFIVTHNTLLAIAAALQKFQEKKYDRILITRPMSQVGRHDLGALPGNVDEKFGPYLENYLTNIQQLVGDNKKSIDYLMEAYNIQAMPLQLIRGASWTKTFIIADEVQVLDFHEMLTLGTRIGEGSKLVVLGDLRQRDEKIAAQNTGLYKLMNDTKAKESHLISGIELLKCERSELASLIADIFGDE